MRGDLVQICNVFGTAALPKAFELTPKIAQTLLSVPEQNETSRYVASILQQCACVQSYLELCPQLVNALLHLLLFFPLQQPWMPCQQALRCPILIYHILIPSSFCRRVDFCLLSF